MMTQNNQIQTKSRAFLCRVAAKHATYASNHFFRLTFFINTVSTIAACEFSHCSNEICIICLGHYNVLPFFFRHQIMIMIIMCARVHFVSFTHRTHVDTHFSLSAPQPTAHSFNARRKYSLLFASSWPQLKSQLDNSFSQLPQWLLARYLFWFFGIIFSNW